MKQNAFDETIRLAEEVVSLRSQLSSAENRLRSLLAVKQTSASRSNGAKTSTPLQGRQAVNTTPAGSAAPRVPVTQRVRKFLASGEGESFSTILAAVSKGGSATKFAVRSALQKDREKGTISFDGQLYRLVENGQKKTPGK